MASLCQHLCKVARPGVLDRYSSMFLHVVQTVHKHLETHVTFTIRMVLVNTASTNFFASFFLWNR